MFNKILVKNGKRAASLLAAALMLCGLAGCSERKTVPEYMQYDLVGLVEIPPENTLPLDN